MSRKHKQSRQARPSRYQCEAETAPGLERIAAEELRRRFGTRITRPQFEEGAGYVRFGFEGSLEELLILKTVIAVYIALRFDVPRPKALLGHQHFTHITQSIHTIRSMWPSKTFATLSIGAAGKHTKIMQRLQRALSEGCHLRAAERGDLYLRIRPSAEGGWEVLVRLSPRPLATRAYRLHNMEGALNASVAHALCLLTEPRPSDVFVNIACGSGTLLIERALSGAFRHAIGIDNRAEALRMAYDHIQASAIAQRVHLIQGDARHIPLADGCADVLVADLPFGQLVGDSDSNRALYPAALREGGRIAKDGAAFVLITHAIRLMQEVLRNSEEWETERVLPITLSGLHPRIFLLRRKSRTMR